MCVAPAALRAVPVPRPRLLNLDGIELDDPALTDLVGLWKSLPRPLDEGAVVHRPAPFDGFQPLHEDAGRVLVRIAAFTHVPEEVAEAEDAKNPAHHLIGAIRWQPAWRDDPAGQHAHHSEAERLDVASSAGEQGPTNLGRQEVAEVVDAAVAANTRCRRLRQPVEERGPVLLELRLRPGRVPPDREQSIEDPVTDSGEGDCPCLLTIREFGRLPHLLRRG